MARPAKAIDTNSMKMSKKERKERQESEKKLRGANDKIKPFKYFSRNRSRRNSVCIDGKTCYLSCFNYLIYYVK